MQIFIDQSGKIEYTSKDTAIAYANKKQQSLLIKAKEKRKIQWIFRDAEKPKMFIYKTFAVLIYLLIKDDLSQIDQIIIDREYSGHERLIKQILLQLIRKHGVQIDKCEIQFDSIGKKNNAHKRAIAVFRGKTQPDMRISCEDVLSYIL